MFGVLLGSGTFQYIATTIKRSSSTFFCLVMISNPVCVRVSLGML